MSNIRKLPLMSLVIGLLFAASFSNASAATYWQTGTILRTLTQSQTYGGCMVKLDTPLANGCVPNGWVSLDCDGTNTVEGAGKRAYATALVAMTLGKQISVKYDTSKTVGPANNYCIAVRVDILAQ